MQNTRPLRAIVLTVAFACVLGGCASRGDPRDPMESFNRSMFAFNEGLDKALLKPVAQGYEAVTPAPLRTAVGNFFGNINDIFVGVNNILQGKLQDGGSDFGRVAINTTFGILGIFDVATVFGIEKHEEDFGQTLGRWGLGDGAFLMLPVLGPSTLRDAVGKVGDMAADPVANTYPVIHRNTARGLRLINNRADLLPAEPALEDAALGDKYAYIREAYLQRRRNLIYDGRPPKVRDDYYGEPATR